MPKNYMNDSQASEIMKFISDTMKFPIMGAGGGFAPIGTEAYFDGQVAPLGWVICDGTELNIADYPDLATYYASQHGASNYYGGDGITTFAVPVRNGMPNNEEQIYGTEEHIVGVDKDNKPVYKKGLVLSAGVTVGASWTNVSFSNFPSNINFIYDVQAIRGDNYGKIGDITLSNISRAQGKANWIFATGDIWYVTYTKTNDTAVSLGHSADGNGIFCVKATVSGDANAHQYSTEEQVVGQDENGNTVYERTFIGTADTQDGYYIVSDATLRNIVMISGKVKHRTIQSYEYIMPYIYTASPSTEYAYLLINEGTGVQLYSKGDSYGGQYRVVLQYTKSS